MENENNGIWALAKNFPTTPQGEEFLVRYYDQRKSVWVKVVRRQDMVFRYIWDGVSSDPIAVEIDPVV